MYNCLAELVLYREFGEKSIIKNICDLISEFEEAKENSEESSLILSKIKKNEMIDRIHVEIHRLLDIATNYAFDKNLWHDYIAYLLLTNENTFTMTSERIGEISGSVNEFAVKDMIIFNRLFSYDFSEMEKALEIDAFSTITSYVSVKKRAAVYNRNVSDKVRALSDAIEENLSAGLSERAAGQETLRLVCEFYRKYGVGMFGLNAAFRTMDMSNEAILNNNEDLGGSNAWNVYHGDGFKLVPINNTDKVMLEDLVGYDIQKNRLRENTEAFLEGKPANNVLLYGDAGTGKSTSIKALINEYYDSGLRMIELYKHQMKHLSSIISSIKGRNYRFIIYMDDLSFEENETEYKYLKAVIEGGLETRPDNVLIYATSNRRNLIRETWNDTNDVELDKHRSDTLQEKLSLVSRFGITIPYMRPNKKEYEEIVRNLAGRTGIDMTEEELIAEANKWSVSHGGMSGRVAQQLIDKLT